MPGSKTWAVGEEVLAADFNSYVQTQVVAQFANAAARDAAITAPVEGMVCQLADSGFLFVRRAGAWVVVPAGQIAYAQGPAAQTDVGNAVTSFMTISVTLIAGFKYRVNAYGTGTVVTATAPNLYYQIGGGGGLATTRFAWNFGVVVGNGISGSAARTFTAAASGALVIPLQALCSAGSLRMSPNFCDLAVEHIG